MSEKRCQLIGLVGFIVSGLLFTAAGIRAGDGLAICGSLIWTLSCIVWMIPLMRS